MDTPISLTFLELTFDILFRLGMSHDEESNCDGGSFIMSKSIGPAKVTFSKCSAQHVRNYFQTLNEDCFKVINSLINLLIDSLTN